uniref:SFRICE_019991 n=1 Tax=Spodoptera frugiperda TaxID=7108 RepID=A0A2H1V9S6_SPOFR
MSRRSFRKSCGKSSKTSPSSVLDPVFSTTLSGNPVINIGRYRYNKATSCRGRKVRWYCNRAPAGCRAAIFTFDNVIVDHRHEHNH